MLGFERRRDSRDYIEIGSYVQALHTGLDAAQQRRVNDCKRYWNFYSGQC